MGARIDVTKLHQDRVEMAIIDAFLAELEANKEQMDKLTAVLEKVAAKPLDQEKIQKLIKSKLLPESVQSKTKALEKVPDAITIKQLVFFAFLNEYMTPKIRKALLEKVATKEAEGKIVGPQELRQMVRAEGRAIVLEVRKAIAEIEASLAGE